MLPSELDEVISVMPAMWLNWRSSGVATEEAMICALAPGRLALTVMVGKSTCGSGATGSTTNAMAPAIATATVSSVVATGRWMKGAEMFMRAPWPGLLVLGRGRCDRRRPVIAVPNLSKKM